MNHGASKPLSHSHCATDSPQPSQDRPLPGPLQAGPWTAGHHGLQNHLGPSGKVTASPAGQEAQGAGQGFLVCGRTMALATGFPGAEDAQHHINEAGVTAFSGERARGC